MCRLLPVVRSGRGDSRFAEPRLRLQEPSAGDMGQRNAHERRGKEVGLPPDKVEAILSGLPTAFSAREELVYEIAMALTNSRWVAKGLHDRAVAALGHVGITDSSP